MEENPIRKVLLTMQTHDVRCLLMGGQACVFYGAAEFSRDTDLALLAETENVRRLRLALEELKAEVIAVPPFEIDYLRRGHAVHFRCQHPDAAGMRIDIMSVMRGVDEFPALWSRRCSVDIGPDERYELMGLADLVQAKKTQRDKDWPMIRRLIEAHYQEYRDSPGEQDVRFWFLEARTPDLLIDLSSRFPVVAKALRPRRKLLRLLPDATKEEIERFLAKEESREREADRAYWAPLRREMERLRHGGV